MFDNIIENLPNFWSNIGNVITLVYVITVIATAIIIISQNRSPHKTMSWILVLILVPVVGIVFYLVFGQNYRKQKIFSRKGLVDFIKLEELSAEQLSDLAEKTYIHDPYIEDKTKIVRLLLRNSKAILTNINKVSILNNGDEKFRAMFKAMKKAKHHIHLEYYILESDNIGKELGNILIKKADEGVKVKIIYDDVGSWKLKKQFIRELEKHGIEFACFMPVSFPILTRKINYRNHRKITVVDGRVGFVGGINIADHYIHGNSKIPFWRDTHMMTEGQAAVALQIIFATDWYFLKKELLDDPIYFPEPLIDDKTLVQIVASGPDSDWASIMQAYFTSITLARKNVYISTPYFIPNESILTALKTAALSGIDVKILIPGISDSKFVYFATLSFVNELLETGIEVYIYRKGFNHSKIIMVDNAFCSIGTANMDYRSFSQNFEVNALIYDPVVTSELTYWFFEDLKDSELIYLDEWTKRPVMNKFKANIARIASPLL